MLGASITSGRLITKFGKYKFFPLFGTLMLALGMWLFSHVTVTTSPWELGVWMVVLGLGLGSFMQVATLAVQNSVKREQMGTATSSATFFRSIGSSLGGAIFGTILISRLTHHLAETLPAGTPLLANQISAGGPAALAHVAPAIQQDVLQAFAASFHDMFLIGIPFAVAAFVVALFLRETPLRTSHEQVRPSEEAETLGAHSPVEF
jgi:MFS family permease